MYILLTRGPFDVIAKCYLIFIEKINDFNIILYIYCLQSNKISRIVRTKYSLSRQYLSSNYGIFYY